MEVSDHLLTSYPTMCEWVNKVERENEALTRRSKNQTTELARLNAKVTELQELVHLLRMNQRV